MLNHLSGKEADVFSVDVLAERHLQQRQSHVECLDKVRFPSKRVIPEGMLIFVPTSDKFAGNCIRILLKHGFRFLMKVSSQQRHIFTST